MQLDYQTIILLSVALFHSSIIAAIAFLVRRSKSSRSKPLWKLIAVDGVIFLVGLLFFWPTESSPTILNLLARTFYLVIGAFVLAVEIPGYMMLSRFDDKSFEYLTQIRGNVVKISYSFEYIADLKAKIAENPQVLAEVKLDELLHEFVDSCERMKNVDRNFWGLVLAELTDAIKEVSERSKQPMPRLIDVLSLAGLSFLLAQFLKLLG